MLDQAFEQPLFADPADIVAGGPLALVKQGEVNASRTQQAGHRLVDLLVARVERGVVADEPQHIGGLLADVLDRKLEVLGPGPALARVLPEAVPQVRDGVEGGLQLGVHLALLHQMAPHLQDYRRMFDADRTDLRARAAAGAGPQGLRVDDIADEIHPLGRPPLGGVVVLAEVEDQVAGAQRSPDGGRGAGFVALAATDAGVEVEGVLPRELLDRRHADMPGLFVHARQPAQGLGITDHERTQRGDHVLGLVPGNRRDERQREHAVDPPVRAPHRRRAFGVHAQPLEHPREAQAHGRPGLPRRLVHRQTHRLLDEAGHRDEQQDADEQPVLAPPPSRGRAQLRFAPVGAPVLELRQAEARAAPDHEDEPRDQRHPGDVHHEAEDEIEAPLPEGEAKQRFGDLVLEGDDRGADEQQDEAVEDLGVPVPREAVAAEGRPLREHLADHPADSGPDIDRQGM